MIKKIKVGLKWFWKSFIWLAILLFAIDLITKLVVQANVTEGTKVWLIPNFLYVTLTYNLGMAWSLLSGTTGRIVLAVVSWVAAVAIILYVILRYKKIKQFTKAILFVVLAGCVGNLIDRTFYPKGVIDWIGVMLGNYAFPVFNIADAALVIGLIMAVVLIIVDGVIEVKNKRKEEIKEVQIIEHNDENIEESKPSIKKKEKLVILSKDELDEIERRKKEAEEKSEKEHNSNN